MEKTRTTYAVYNLIEWQALLKMGKGTVKVPFSGGSMTTQGVTPATHTTEDPIIQFAIERSPEFKSGKIKVIRRVKLGGKIEIERNAPKPVQEPVQESCADDCEETSGDDDATEDAADDAEAVAPKGLTQVEFSYNDEAKDYLERTYGVERNKMHTRADIVAIALSKGVDLKFI